MVFLMTSCSSDYVNVIPEGSTAIVAFDPSSMSKAGDKSINALKSLLQVDDLKGCGLDLGEKLYAFETPDGSLGLLAKVADDGDVEQWLGTLASKGEATKIKERKDVRFSIVHGNFVAGFTDDAFLIMGPSVGAAQAELQRQMIKYLKDGGDDNATRETPLFQRLETLSGPVTMVAQAQALPDKIAAPMTLGAPKGTSPADVYVAATMTVEPGGIVSIEGENFSFDKTIDQALKTAASRYKPVKGTYLNVAPTGSLLVMSCGVNGNDYIEQLRSNEAFRTILLGLNTALDVDMMLKSVDGDLLITIPAAHGDKYDFQLVADTRDRKWLSDVDYWKKSCPKGSSITDWTQPGTYHFSSADWNVWFGINGRGSLFFGSSEQLAAATSKPSATPLPRAVVDKMRGKRLCMMVGIDALAAGQPDVRTALNVLRPVLGDVRTIVYSIK